MFFGPLNFSGRWPMGREQQKPPASLSSESSPFSEVSLLPADGHKERRPQGRLSTFGGAYSPIGGEPGIAHRRVPQFTVDSSRRGLQRGGSPDRPASVSVGVRPVLTLRRHGPKVGQQKSSPGLSAAEVREQGELGHKRHLDRAGRTSSVFGHHDLGDPPLV